MASIGIPWAILFSTFIAGLGSAATIGCLILWRARDRRGWIGWMALFSGVHTIFTLNQVVRNACPDIVIGDLVMRCNNASTLVTALACLGLYRSFCGIVPNAFDRVLTVLLLVGLPYAAFSAGGYAFASVTSVSTTPAGWWGPVVIIEGLPDPLTPIFFLLLQAVLVRLAWIVAVHRRQLGPTSVCLMLSVVVIIEFPLVYAYGLIAGWWRGVPLGEYALTTMFFVLCYEIYRRERDLYHQEQEHQELLVAKTAAEQANAAKGIFLASMSHEIRTPLNAVLGYAQLLMRDRSLGATQHQAVTVINRSGEHLLQLINDILELSRLEAGHGPVVLADFDLQMMLDHLHSLFLQRARDKGLQVRVALPTEIPRYLYGDERRLRQILTNLIGNAVKFTEAGEIEVGVVASGGRIQFMVRDTGSGIAPTEISKLFTPFVQTTSGQRRRDGTGLGLAISQGFARQLGGNIAVSSVLDVGTTFTVDLPLREAIGSPITESQRQPGILMDGQRPPKLLVVVDHADSRALLVDLLRAAGCEVEAVADGAAAVTACRQAKPDLVWMDIDLPIMDGLSAAQAIRALPGPPPVIIALTAASFPEDQARILAGGCDEVAHKPFQAEALFRIMERRLHLRFKWQSAADVRRQSSAPSKIVLTAELVRERFGQLPSAMQTRFAQAVMAGDVRGASAQLIGWADRPLAEACDSMLSRFDLAQLQALVSQDGAA